MKKLATVYIYDRIEAFVTSVLILLFLVFIAQQGQAQPPLNVWGNNGTNGWVDSVVVDPLNPNIVFAAGEHGVSKSMNYGATWSMSNQGLSPVCSPGWLVIDTQSPNTLYVTDFNAGNTMYKTTNGGGNWSRNNSPGRFVLAVAPSNSRIIYGLDWTSLLVTRDGGETWNTLPFPEPPLYAPEVFVIDPHDPNIIYTWAQDYDFNLMGLFKSTNGGASWTRLYYPGIASDIQTFALKIDPANTNIIYTTTNFGVYKSTDAGANWTLRDSLQNTSALELDPLGPGTLYAGVYDAGVYKSTDDGGNWSAFNDGLTDLRLRDLEIDKSGRFLHAATSNGVFSVRLREDSPSVSVSGRVIAPSGHGLRNATVSLTDQFGVARTTTTSSFGFYSFANTQAGEAYTISVASRLYRFTPRTVTLNDNLTDIDFVGLE